MQRKLNAAALIGAVAAVDDFPHQLTMDNGQFHDHKFTPLAQSMH